jgi:hypothetical protein
MQSASSSAQNSAPVEIGPAPSTTGEQETQVAGGLWSLERPRSQGATVVERGSVAPVAIDPRQAGRELARGVSPTERDALYEEHARLADAHFTRGLSRREQARFRFLQWQIDNIEDADVGEELDALETLAVAHEALAADIDRFSQQVASVRRRPR